MPGISVYELEGVLNNLDEGKEMFDISHGIEPLESKKVVDQLDAYLSDNLKTADSIQLEMKNNLSRILGPEGMPEGEMKILREIVYDFDAVVDLLTEDDQ